MGGTGKFYIYIRIFIIMSQFKRNKTSSSYLLMKDMLNKVRIIKEQSDDRYNADLSAVPNQEQEGQEFNINGEKISAPGELSDTERNTFTQSIDEFQSQVSELVEFNCLQIKQNEIHWSGKLIKFDVDFYYILGSKNGVYLKGDMIKIDEEFSKMVTSLTEYYKTFTTNWSPILTERRNQSKQSNV
jgi:hypothetical protein